MKRINLALVVLLFSTVTVALAQDISVRVDASRPGRPVSRYLTGACIEDVNHEIYGGIYSQMIFGESFQEPPRKTPARGAAAPNPLVAAGISGMWGPISTGSAILEAAIEKDRPFLGNQSQRITFAGGQGEVGVENQGLNHWGIALAAGKPYEGYVWLRADKAVEVIAAFESRDGSHSYARSAIQTAGQEWHRYDFKLSPDGSDIAGRFSLRLAAPGSVVIGHAFVQPGEWGRFKGLPVRNDVVQGLIDQGITVLRYGGSMVNAREYRWKKMVGPRDRRVPYKGTWYPYSSNGWGIIDFLDLCEAAGFMAIPDLNIDESPKDMADFIEYVNGPADSEWGRRRAADGHPAPYHLSHIELGNEEKVDEAYCGKFEKIASAVWAKDPQIILVVGDFQYERPIADPMHIEGADSKITSLAGQQKILDLARQNNREVWFDIHQWTQGPAISPSSKAMKSYVDAIDALARGARHHVVVFEFNANRHDQRRALLNAVELTEIIRDGRLPVALSANCLQPDGQNDNGWDQGLLFLNPAQVWLQPPGYVTQLFAKNYQPRVVESQIDGDATSLHIAATQSEDGHHLVLFAVNLSEKPVTAQLHLAGFAPAHASAEVEELAGAADAANRASDPMHIAPRQSQWEHHLKEDAAKYAFPPESMTVIRFE